MNVIEENIVFPKHKIQPNGQLDAILGNMKPLINILQDETDIVISRGTIMNNCVFNHNQI